jgi:adenylate cyclase
MRAPSSSTRRVGAHADARSAAGIAAVTAGALALAWLLTLLAAGAGADWNSRPNDSLFRLRHALRGTQKIQRTILHVDLTDSMVEELGMHGTERRDFARLVKVLSAAGASSILFDIVFPAAGTPAGDAALARAAREAGSVYLPAVMRAAGLDGAARPAGKAAEPLARWLWHPAGAAPAGVPAAATATLSYDELSAAARGVGSINSDPDPDGVYRRMPLLIRCGDGYMPTLALRAAADILGVDAGKIEVSLGRRIRLPGARLPDGSVRDVSIPVDRAGRIIVDYAGPWASSFPHFSFARALDAETDPDVADGLAEALDGAHVIVSDLTTSAADYGAVPLERVYPRSGIHANILNSILSNRFLRAPTGAEALLLTLAFAALLWLVTWRLRPLFGTLLALACWAALAAGEISLFLSRGILPSLAAPTIGFVLALVAVNALRFFQAERDRLRTRARMERYFAPRLMSKILQDPDRLMSAEQKVVSVLFSDISGFTSWCTTQPPEAIHRTLNEYFEEMTEIVFRNEGTVDKFIGDGLMAFFGDPLPQADHALRAVRTGVEMQQAVRGLRARWEAEGRMPIHIRVGINSGEVVVGDMGSRRIMAYTAIGSHVNLASRLESKAPVDGVLVSEPVYLAVRESVSTRSAGRITAKGISEGFETYEVIVP